MRASQLYPLSPLCFNIVLEDLADCIRQEREKDRDWEGRTTTILRDSMTIFTETPFKTLPKKKKATITSQFSKIAKYKNNIQNSVLFLHTCNIQWGI